MLDGEVESASVSDMPVRIKVLIGNGQDEGGGRCGVHGCEWWEGILYARRAERVGEADAGQRNRRAEGRVLHEVVIQARERLDIEETPAAANGGGMSARGYAVREAEARGEVVEIGVGPALGEIGIAGEKQSR